MKANGMKIPEFHKQPMYSPDSISTADSNCSQYAADFEFPDGGWECSKCQNYNFKGRKSCNRCKKSKSNEDNDGKPEHMFKAAEEKAVLKI